MSEKNYFLISATIFAFVAILHALRLATNLSVQIGAAAFPIWGSWLGAIVASALSIWAFRLMWQWQQTDP